MQFAFALCFEGKLAAELRKAGAEVYLLGSVKVSRPWTMWQAQSELNKLLVNKDFDVVICHACWTQAIFGGKIRAAQRPLVFWCHDYLQGEHWLEKWARINTPSLAIANSRYTLTSIPLIYTNIPSQVLFYPVQNLHLDEPNIRQVVRSQLNTPQETVVIILGARLEPWKGHSLLIAAFGELKNLTNWKCWIAGGVQRNHEKAYLRELEKQVNRLGITERVSFLGQRGDMSKLLAAADIHCQPNTGAEPFGIAFIEALYAGLPVVTTAMGGGAEIVDESCGCLVEPDNIQALSKVLASLITDAEYRYQLSLGTKARAKQLCDPQTQLDRLYSVLAPLIS